MLPITHFVLFSQHVSITGYRHPLLTIVSSKPSGFRIILSGQSCGTLVVLVSFCENMACGTFNCRSEREPAAN